MQWLIGKRVAVDKDVGTLRFVGPLRENESDSFWGIEWDNALRGKHNGTFGGTRYFDCREATGGSFVRASKPIHLGESLIYAIADAYLEPFSSQERSKKMMFQTKTVEIDLVEAPPRQQIGLSKRLDVSHRSIQCFSKSDSELLQRAIATEKVTYHADTADSLRQDLIGIEEIDLSFNLLSSWAATIDFIALLLPGCRVIHFSGNRFSIVTSASAMTSVQSVFLNDTFLSFDQIMHGISAFPNLTELHACANQLSSLFCVASLSHWSFLKLVDLQGNSLSSWQSLLPIFQLPSLTTLLLADNQLADDVHLLCTPASSTLTSLSLQNNRISLWTTLYQFSPLFPALKSLRLRGNPMTPVFKIPMSTESLRPACIACMPALHHLNGSAITGKERDSSERWYIGVCHTALLQEKSAFKEVFYDHHPQLATLEEKHGRPFCAQTQCVANMVTIHVAADGHISRELQVPLSMTVTQLRALGRKLFGKVYSAIDLVDDETHERTTLSNDDASLSDCAMKDVNELIYW